MNEPFPFTLMGTKTADELKSGDWIISHGQFVRFVNLTPTHINTTGKLRERFGADYRYNVYKRTPEKPWGFPHI